MHGGIIWHCNRRKHETKFVPSWTPPLCALVRTNETDTLFALCRSALAEPARPLDRLAPTLHAVASQKVRRAILKIEPWLWLAVSLVHIKDGPLGLEVVLVVLQVGPTATATLRGAYRGMKMVGRLIIHHWQAGVSLEDSNRPGVRDSAKSRQAMSLSSIWPRAV